MECNHYEITAVNIAGMWLVRCEVCRRQFYTTLEVYDGRGELYTLRIDNSKQVYDPEVTGIEREVK